MKSCNQLCLWNTLYGCKKPENEPCILSNMACEKFEPKPQTNADHIRSMTDEELTELLVTKFSCFECPARILCNHSIGNTCDQLIGFWLKQPYGGDT